MRLVTLLALVALLATAPAGLAQAWAAENADAANTGHLARATPDGLGGARETELGADAITQVVEGPASLALVGDLDGTLHAITATGQAAWTADTGGPLRTAPLWTGEIVVALPRGDAAVAYAPDGPPVWTLPVDNERPDATVVRMASPAPHPSGDLLLATLAGNVHRVAENGTVVWTHGTGGDRAVEATPAVAPDGDVLVASFTPGEEGAGRLERLDAATGDPVWRHGIGSQVVGAPTVVGDRVLVPLRDATAVEARALDDGSREWSVGFDDRVTMSPAVHEGIAVAGDVRGVVRGIDVASGDVAWTFNPLQDDPNSSNLPGSECTVLTVADSPAIDADGIAWTPYWNANICEGFPPRDSGPSPVYLLDVHGGGSVEDRERYDKANHGPGLHATGVWAGTDDGLVRTWPMPGALAAHAYAVDEQVTLVTNTDLSGDWTIDWGPEQESGAGVPPTVATATLEPGEHTVTVTVDGATATAPVTVAGGGQEAGDTAPGGAEGPLAREPIDAENGSADEDGVPAPGALAALVALATLALAGRPRRG